MHLDVQDLRNFYYRSPLGRAAQASVRAKMHELWPEAKGQTLAGYGFAVPLLRPYLAHARRVIALMPGPQGVIAWPSGAPNVSVLTEETCWPLETGLLDKLVVMHGLETSEWVSDLLEECWRTLGPGGKALFIVPNRAGLWSRSDRTPFGFGHPYSLGQLETLLKRHHFVPERHASALYQPPSYKRFWRRSGTLLERMGARIPAIFAGGVLLVEASKRAQPPKGRLIKSLSVRPKRAMDGLAEPA